MEGCQFQNEWIINAKLKYHNGEVHLHDATNPVLSLDIKLDSKGEQLLKRWNDGPYPEIFRKKALLRERFDESKEMEWRLEMARLMQESIQKLTKADRELNALMLCHIALLEQK